MLIDFESRKNIANIDRLFTQSEADVSNDIIGLAPPLTPKSLSLIDDVVALLEHPSHRCVAQSALEDALQGIASDILNRAAGRTTS